MKDCAISKMLFFYFVYIKCILISKLDGERRFWLATWP